MATKQKPSGQKDATDASKQAGGAGKESEEEEGVESSEPHLAAALATAGDAAAVSKLLKAAGKAGKRANLGDGAGLLAVLAHMHMVGPISQALVDCQRVDEAGGAPAAHDSIAGAAATETGAHTGVCFGAAHQALAIALQSNLLQAAHVVREQLLRAQRVCVRQSEERPGSSEHTNSSGVSESAHGRVEASRTQQLKLLVQLLLAPILPDTASGDGDGEAGTAGGSADAPPAMHLPAFIACLSTSKVSGSGAVSQQDPDSSSAQTSSLAQAAAMADLKASRDLQDSSFQAGAGGHCLHASLACSVLAAGMHTLSMLGEYAQPQAVGTWLQLLLQVHASGQSGDGGCGGVAQPVWELLRLREFTALPAVAAALPAAFCAARLQHTHAAVAALQQAGSSDIEASNSSEEYGNVGGCASCTSDQVQALMKLASKLQASQDVGTVSHKLKKAIKAQAAWLADETQVITLQADAQQSGGGPAASSKKSKKQKGQAEKAPDSSSSSVGDVCRALRQVQVVLQAELQLGHVHTGQAALSTLHTHHTILASLLLELLRGACGSEQRGLLRPAVQPLLACVASCLELGAAVMTEQLSVRGPAQHPPAAGLPCPSKLYLKWLTATGSLSAQLSAAAAATAAAEPGQTSVRYEPAHRALSSSSHALQVAAQLACMPAPAAGPKKSTGTTAGEEQEGGRVAGVVDRAQRLMSQAVKEMEHGSTQAAGAKTGLGQSSGAVSVAAHQQQPWQQSWVHAVHAASLVHGVRAHVEGQAGAGGKRRVGRSTAAAAAAAVSEVQGQLCELMEVSATAVQRLCEGLRIGGGACHSSSQAEGGSGGLQQPCTNTTGAVLRVAACLSCCTAIVDIDNACCGGDGARKVAAGKHEAGNQDGASMSDMGQAGFLSLGSTVQQLLPCITQLLGGGPDQAALAGVPGTVQWELLQQAGGTLAAATKWCAAQQQRGEATSAPAPAAVDDEAEEQEGGADGSQSESEQGPEEELLHGTNHTPHPTFGSVHRTAPESSSHGSSDWVCSLLETHVAALSSCCPPALPPHTGKGGIWGALLSDLAPGSQAAAMRAALLGSVNGLLHTLRAAPLHRLLKWLAGELDACTAGHSGSSLDAGRQSARVAALAQCTVLVLELEAGPRATQVLVSVAPALASALCRLVQATPSAVLQAVGRNPAAGLQKVIQPMADGAQGVRSVTAACFSALRGLESILGRPITFTLAGGTVPGMLGVLAGLLQPYDTAEALRRAAAATGLHSAPSSLLTGCLSLQEGGGLLCGAASVVATALRHRAPAARRAMPLVAACARGMLAALVQWAVGCVAGRSADQEAQLLRCAAAIARYGMAVRVYAYCMRIW